MIQSKRKKKKRLERMEFLLRFSHRMRCIGTFPMTTTTIQRSAQCMNPLDHQSYVFPLNFLQSNGALSHSCKKILMSILDIRRLRAYWKQTSLRHQKDNDASKKNCFDPLIKSNIGVMLVVALIFILKLEWWITLHNTLSFCSIKRIYCSRCVRLILDNTII
jgi:hypothetical protein